VVDQQQVGIGVISVLSDDDRRKDAVPVATEVSGTASAVATRWAGRERSPRLSRMFQDAAWIALSSGIAAGLGMAFWVAAARFLTPSQLGVQTAIIAAIIAPGTVVAAGVGDALNAVAGTMPEHRKRLIRHAYALVVAAGVPLAIISAAVVILVLEPADPVSVGLTVVLGVLIWALFTIQDSALTTLGRTRWLPIENALASAAKVLLILLLHTLFLGVVWATLLPAAIGVVVLAPVVERISRATRPRYPSPAGPGTSFADARRTFAGLAVRTTTSVALTLGALAFLPFVVTAVAGPAEGALFSLALSIVGVLDYISGGIGIALVVHVAEDREGEQMLVRHALRRTLAVVSLAAVLVIAVARPALNALDPDYLALHGVAVIAILAPTSVLRTVYLVWSSRQQVRREMGSLLRLNAVAAALVYGLILGLGSRYGALLGACALAAAQLVLTGGALVRWRDVYTPRGQMAARATAQVEPFTPEGMAAR